MQWRNNENILSQRSIYDNDSGKYVDHVVFCENS